jgi:mannose/fructose/N-acetylgalactosamine-specific phosphotransferase system component IID
MFSAAYLIAHDSLSLLRAVDDVPEEHEVKAGYLGLFVVLALIAAVVVISVSLSKQLRRAREAKAAGVYGDEPETGVATESSQD